MSSKFDDRGDTPSQRVLSVENVMDVARAILWPDAGNERPAESDNGETAMSRQVADRRRPR